MAKTKTAPKTASKKAAPKTTTAKKTAPKRKAASSKAGDKSVSIDRRRASRRKEAEAAETPAEAPKLERREKVSRRRQIDPTTCERDYSDSEVQFMNALDDYKRKSGRMFPTCSEVLEVIRGLGYVQLDAAELAARRGPEEADLEAQAEAEALEAMADSESLAAAE